MCEKCWQFDQIMNQKYNVTLSDVDVLTYSSLMNERIKNSILANVVM